MNILFTLAYFLCGFENISGIDEENGNTFLQAFFFSIQTFTTVGYGALSPTGAATQSVAAVEAFIGFLSFSLATGLLYGRFSRPNAKLIFAHNILYAKFLDGYGIMLKFANERESVLLEVEAKVILTFVKEAEIGELIKEYFILPLELNKVELLPFTWTLVHKIDEKSPFFDLTEETIIKKNPEFLVLIKGFDEIYGQQIHTKYSYSCKKMLWNKKFVKTFHAAEDGVIEMDLRNINLTEDEK